MRFRSTRRRSGRQALRAFPRAQARLCQAFAAKAFAAFKQPEECVFINEFSAGGRRFGPPNLNRAVSGFGAFKVFSLPKQRTSRINIKLRFRMNLENFARKTKTIEKCFFISKTSKRVCAHCAQTRRWVVLGRKYHCFVHCKVAVAFNGNTALILSFAEQVCGIQIGEDSVKRGKQLTTRSVDCTLVQHIERLQSLAEVKLDNIKFGLYISFFTGVLLICR